MNELPRPRGEITGLLLKALAGDPHDLPAVQPPPSPEPLSDEDLQLALYVCYELHYRGLPGVAEEWEWEPSLLALRQQLEHRLEQALLEAVPRSSERIQPQEVDLALRAIAESEQGPSLSTYIQNTATAEQVREFVIHRSAYQLKEADPHSWAIPRLTGPPKAALLEIQFDEYGRGRTQWIHAELFASTMRDLALDHTYGAYLDRIPGVTLANVNLMSWFGLHRRLRAAIIGHLALFEMTSSIPNGHYANGLRRLGFGQQAIQFFEEHVTADAVHENIAAVDLAGGFLAQEPEAGGLLLWGARTLGHLDARWAAHLMGCWQAGRSSLLAGPAGSAETNQLVGAVAERLDLRSATPA